MARRKPSSLTTVGLSVRRILIVAFLFIIGAAALLIAAWPSTVIHEPAIVDVVIDGPDGLIWNGTVTADPGTAFGALVAAADEGGFMVGWRGQGKSLYVYEIAGHDESGGGWCVQTNNRSGSGWQDSSRSAALRSIADGWGVRWYWTDGQCDRF